MPLDPRHAVYAGSFDPPTAGHLDVIGRGAELFERLTVAVGVNPDKKPLLDAHERVAMLRELCAVFPNVEVRSFSGLTVGFVRDCGAAVMLRGLRGLADIELELTMSLTNRSLEPGIETVFLMANAEYTHISSTLIKQIAKLGGPGVAEQLREMVPPPVVAPLLAKYHGGDG